MSARATLGCSVLPRIHKEGDDGFFAKRLGGLQPVQTLNKYEARAVRPDQDRRLQALVENAGRDLVYSFWFEGHDAWSERRRQRLGWSRASS